MKTKIVIHIEVELTPCFPNESIDVSSLELNSIGESARNSADIGRLGHIGRTEVTTYLKVKGA